MKKNNPFDSLPFADRPLGQFSRDPSRPVTGISMPGISMPGSPLSAAELSALADGRHAPLCEVGTWIPSSSPSPSPDEDGASVPVRREHSRRVRTADFLTYPYPLRVECAPGYSITGFTSSGAPLRESETRPGLLVPANTPFVLVIAADEEPKGRLTPEDAARYAAAIRIPTRTAADVASVAESLGIVSESVLTAVSAVAEAEEMLADRMTGLIEGSFSPILVPGRWNEAESAPKAEDDPRACRTLDCLSFRYDAAVECGEGFRVTAHREDGSFFGGWGFGGAFRIPAETRLCLTVERIGSDLPLDPADAARAVKILTMPAMEIARIDARVRALEALVRRLNAANTRNAG